MLAAAWTRRHVRALDDPVRDGQVVLSRGATKSTMLGWLSATINGASSRYDVRLDLGAPTYDATTGHPSEASPSRTAAVTLGPYCR